MCGFTGFYKKNTDASHSERYVICKNMTETLAHRGPDSSGIWQDPDVPIALGHRRLSIIDLSEEGHQPMASATERYLLSYNGEIYNYIALQKELEKAGISLRGRSDTEVILAAIEYWGLNLTLQKLNGMFAFALWDRKARQLHFVRDRMGKKPVYIGWAGDTLLFGSELKALRAHPDFKAEINRDALALFARYSAISAPHCIYKNVWALPAGFSLTLNIEDLNPRAELSTLMKPYWHHLNKLNDAREQKEERPESVIIEEFEELLTQCVEERLISDVPLGAFLSGGIDSSTIVALMQKISSQPIKTYSVGFEESGFNEAEYAKKVAAHLGTDHHELYVSQSDVLNALPRLPNIYDEPFGDISAIPTYLVSKFARQDVTVALSGDGGDEMLGGYNRHIMGPKIWKRTGFIPSFIRNNLANFIQKIPVNKWDKVNKNSPQFGTRIHKAASILSLDTQEDIYERLISQWDDNPVLNSALLHSMKDTSEWTPENLSFAEKMMYWDTLSYLPNDILTKVDRASMAVSLEARAPLLDKRLYDYVWRLPENYKIRNGQGKWLLRQVLHKHVPEALFDRPKQGFTMPIGAWLRGELKDWAEELLDKKRLQEENLFDSDLIRATWEAHQRGEGNHAGALWNILMFQTWHDTWM